MSLCDTPVPMESCEAQIPVGPLSVQGNVRDSPLSTSLVVDNRTDATRLSEVLLDVSTGREEQPEVLPDDRLIASITAAHQACVLVTNVRWHFYFHTGNLLLELKRRTPHGGLGKRVDTEFTFGRRMARTYMKLAEHRHLLEPLILSKRKSNSVLPIAGALSMVRSSGAKSKEASDPAIVDTTNAASNDISAVTVAKNDHDQPLLDLVRRQPDYEESALAESLDEADKPGEERKQDGPESKPREVPGHCNKVQAFAQVEKVAPEPGQHTNTATKSNRLTRISKHIEDDYQEVADTTCDIKPHDLTDEERQTITNMIKTVVLMKESLEQVLTGAE